MISEQRSYSMIKISIVTAGDLSVKSFRDACDRYKKMMTSQIQMTETEIRVRSPKKEPSKEEIKKGLAEEATEFRKAIPKGSFVIALCVEGQQMTSEKFAGLIDSEMIKGKSSFCFLVGSSYGMDEKLKKESDLMMSFSEMTFPHELFRVMLFEQIYRAFSILDNKKYHK